MFYNVVPDLLLSFLELPSFIISSDLSTEGLDLTFGYLFIRKIEFFLWITQCDFYLYLMTFCRREKLINM